MTSQLSLGAWAPPLNPALGQYHTPAKLARKMVQWAGVRAGQTVLEPSAGGGNIVRELVAVGADVVAVEIDPAWSALLEESFLGVDVQQLDFLGAQFADVHPVDIAVANPPLDGGQAGAHLWHMLHFARRAVSVLRSQDLHGGGRWRDLWSRCDLARVAYLVHRPIYAGDGGSFETVVVDIYRRGTYHGPQSMEHWAEDWR